MGSGARRTRFARLPAMQPRLDVLPEPQVSLWSLLGEIPDHFVLYGGTAIALRLGHRRSIDFDFFSAEPFTTAGLLRDLAWLGRVEILDSAQNSLVVVEPGGVQLAFYGGMRLQAVAEPSLAPDNGLVIASIFDLAGTKAKALLDRSEWKDYVDVATILAAGHALTDVIGYAAAIFDPLFVFPAPVFLRNLVWFGDGTAPDVPADVRHALERAVATTDLADIPLVEPYRDTIDPR